MPPIVIVVGGVLLEGYTSMSLTRSKNDMTGTLSVTVFWGYLPNQPVLTAARAGAPIMVYIGGHLAFIGKIDSRGGASKKGNQRNSNQFSGGKGRQVSLGSGKQAGGKAGVSSHADATSYIVTIKARGMTRDLIDSSHQHKTGTITGAKTKPVIATLIKDFGIQLDWRGAVVDMDKVRFRDGAIVSDEIHRVCQEYGYWAYETRDGKLRVTEMAGPETGEPIIVGDGGNVLAFEVEQSDNHQNSELKVKGQRTKRNMRGKQAVEREKRVKTGSEGFRPYTMQHYTDGSDEALQRRIKHEADVRNAESKKVKARVFHVQPRTGGYWDVGMLHYVQIPTEGVFEVMECTDITYSVDATKRLQTMMTLSPPPSGGGGAGGFGSIAGSIAGFAGALGGTGGGALANLAGRAGAIDIGAAAREQLGIKLEPGKYPLSWGPVQLADVALDAVTTVAAETGLAAVLEGAAPLILPPEWGGTGGA